MTAQDFFNERFQHGIHEILGTSEVLQLMKAFALLKCAEQREICADNAHKNNDFFKVIDQESILNAPNPLDLVKNV